MSSSMALPIYSPDERAREKQASRDEDERRLAAGEVSREQLRRENGRFAFPEVMIDFAAAVPLR
jgi:hypothetical protein